MRSITVAGLLLIALSGGALAETRSERCEFTADIRVRALDLLDTGTSEQEALDALQAEHPDADMREIEVAVQFAYSRPGDKRGEEARSDYVDICMSM